MKDVHKCVRGCMHELGHFKSGTKMFYRHGGNAHHLHHIDKNGNHTFTETYKSRKDAVGELGDLHGNLPHNLIPNKKNEMS